MTDHSAPRYNRTKAFDENMMNTQEYIDYCYQQQTEIFVMAKQNRKDERLKYRVEGLMQAGKVLGIFSHQQATDLIEKAHFETFNETIQQRVERKQSLRDAITNSDDDYINIPSVIRKNRQKPTKTAVILTVFLTL